jgi:hypothetical protein
VSRLAFLLVIAALTAASSSAPAWAQEPVQIKTSISPGWIYFADELTARVDVIVNRSQVDLSTLQVQTSFGPWEQATNSVTTKATSGNFVHQTTVFTLRCISFNCVPKGTVVQRFYLPVVTVTGQSNGGASLTFTHPFPPVNVAGRFLPPPSGAFRPALVPELNAPPLRYRVSPSLAAFAFDAGATLAGLVALVLAVLEVRRYAERRRHAVDDRPPLERALSLVREAQSRDVEDRRRAVALLARLLPSPTAERTTAAEIAWSRPEPSPDELGDLAETIQTTIVDPK